MGSGRAKTSQVFVCQACAGTYLYFWRASEIVCIVTQARVLWPSGVQDVQITEYTVYN